MVLAKLTEFAGAGRARSEMMDPRHRFLERNFAGCYRFANVRARATFPLKVWMVLEKRLPEQLSKSFFFTLG
jgi:hypothetical protein